MGAAIAIPVLTMILLALGYALWALYVAVVEAIGFAKSARRHGSGETAAHYQPGDHEHVSTKPMQGYDQPR